MEINVEWLDTQEPGPYVVAVQEAWDKVPAHWVRLLPQKTILFLGSPGTEAQVYNSTEALGQDGRIFIVLPKDYEYEQVFMASLYVLAHAFSEIVYVSDLIKLVANQMLRRFSGDFTEEEKKFVYDPNFSTQLFLSAFMSSVLGLAGQQSSKPFVHEFFQHVDRAVKVSERRA